MQVLQNHSVFGQMRICQNRNGPTKDITPENSSFIDPLNGPMAGGRKSRLLANNGHAGRRFRDAEPPER
jgi:hypothetical protein